MKRISMEFYDTVAEVSNIFKIQEISRTWFFFIRLRIFKGYLKLSILGDFPAETDATLRQK